MSLVWRLTRYLKIVWPLFLLGTVLLLVATAGVQFLPLVAQRVIDEVLTPAAAGHPLAVSLLVRLLAIYIALMSISSLVGYGASWVLMHCANRVAEALRNEAYEVMQRLPISYFDDKPAGKIAARIVNDTETLRSQFYGVFLAQVLRVVLPIFYIYGISFYLNVWLGSVLLLLIPITYVWHQVYQKQTGSVMNTFYEARSDVNSQVTEVMSGHDIIQLYDQEEAMRAQFRSTTQRMLDAENQLCVTETSILWGLSELLKRVSITVLLTVMGMQFLGEVPGITAGLIFTYITYTDQLFSSLEMLLRFLPGVQRSLTTGRRVFELLDAAVESNATQPLTVREGVLDFEHVTFGYESDHMVLRDISFHAARGETIALVGHTGSGKSSLINLLFRFYDPQSGRILIDGQNIAHCNRESVRAEMGIVLQDSYLFSGTIASNVAMDDQTMSEETITQALQQVGAGPLLQRVAQGIHEPVVEKGNSFSSGERQLISFARALAADPKILILDEATSHIDTETEEQIQYAMDVVKKGRTTLIIAHRLSTIQNADRILVLHEGQIVEQGTHHELLAHNGRYAEMHRMQQQVS